MCAMSDETASPPAPAAAAGDVELVSCASQTDGASSRSHSPVHSPASSSTLSSAAAAASSLTHRTAAVAMADGCVANGADQVDSASPPSSSFHHSSVACPGQQQQQSWPLGAAAGRLASLWPRVSWPVAALAAATCSGSRREQATQTSGCDDDDFITDNDAADSSPAANSTDNGTSPHRPYPHQRRRLPLDPLQLEAERLARDVVHHVLDQHRSSSSAAAVTRCSCSGAADPVARTLRRAADEILTKHRLLLNGMVARLQIGRDSCYTTFVSVADELFADATVTWARIVTLYAFGARLALYCQEKEMADYVPEITRCLGVYVTDHLCDFVRDQGGWLEMCKHFQYPESMESTVLGVLVKLGLGLGIAATATFLSSR